MPCETWSNKWDKPFRYLLQVSDEIELLKKVYCAIGFKMYTALGYRPDEYKERRVWSGSESNMKKTMMAWLPELRNFYGKCEREKIPILCHGSTGGVFAHDFMLYYDYLFQDTGISKEEKQNFYEKEFMSPWAWEYVLEDFKDLYLCLAHFGGVYWNEKTQSDDNWISEVCSDNWVKKLAEMMQQYENFYVDLSYFIFKKKRMQEQLRSLLKIYPKAKYKLLFGTDWYLIGSETAKYGNYDSFTKSLIENLALVDPELPAYCMVINPKKFLRIEIIADKLFEVFGKEYDIRELVKTTMPNTISTFETIHKNL